MCTPRRQYALSQQDHDTLVLLAFFSFRLAFASFVSQLLPGFLFIRLLLPFFAFRKPFAFFDFFSCCFSSSLLFCLFLSLPFKIRCIISLLFFCDISPSLLLFFLVFSFYLSLLLFFSSFPLSVFFFFLF